MKKTYALVVGFLLVCLSVEGSPLMEAGAPPSVFYVGGTGPGNFSSLQAAVRAAEPGDIVVVLGGHPSRGGDKHLAHPGRERCRGQGLLGTC